MKIYLAAFPPLENPYQCKMLKRLGQRNVLLSYFYTKPGEIIDAWTLSACNKENCE